MIDQPRLRIDSRLSWCCRQSGNWENTGSPRTPRASKVVVFEGKSRFLSRQGHPKIAHRFSGGAVLPLPPVPLGTAAPPASESRMESVRRFLSPLTGLGPDHCVFPTAEAVGYCRLSLTGHRAATVSDGSSSPGDFKVFPTLEAMPSGLPVVMSSDNSVALGETLRSLRDSPD